MLAPLLAMLCDDDQCCNDDYNVVCLLTALRALALAHEVR